MMAWFGRVWEFLTSIELLMAMLWLGLAVFSIGLLVLMYTRWGQYNALRKCMGMSLLAHVLLAGYAATIEIIAPSGPVREQVIQLTLGDGPDMDAPPGGSGPEFAKGSDQPWEAFPDDAIVQPGEPTLDRTDRTEPAEPERLVRVDAPRLPGDAVVEHVALADVKPLMPSAAVVAEPAGRYAAKQSAEAIEAPAAQRHEATPVFASNAGATPDRSAPEAAGAPVRVVTDDLPAALLQEIVALPRMTEADTTVPLLVTDGPANPMRLKPVGRIADSRIEDNRNDAADDAAYGVEKPVADQGAGDASKGMAAATLGLPTSLGSDEGGMAGVGTSVGRGVDVSQIARDVADNMKPSVPDAYRLRVAPDRENVTQSHGGTSASEAAVKAALKWLADNQSADGRWDPRIHGAGKETNTLGRNRQSAGSRADTAMTGLALLSFLGSGHTHLEGPYRVEVRRGLEFLMQSQAADGNLGGHAAAYEFMYCHAMATFAMSEAYGMTRDQRLREYVHRAVGYTVAAQDPKGGGWRYRPGDAGDTSQLGWQLMALKSAELAGIPMPEQTRQGIIRYLRSVSVGKSGGLASYRPGEQVTRPMTAEALACWQFLGLPREHPACDEAGDFLLGDLPGKGVYNLYYWYYATLSMYQLQGPHWQRWNESIRTTLVNRQIKEGPLTGSWDTDDLWGGYGGRVFTTSLATLTLEVYYRYLPLYVGTAKTRSQTK